MVHTKTKKNQGSTVYTNLIKLLCITVLCGHKILITTNNTRAFPSHSTSTFELAEEMYVDQSKNGETIITKNGTSLVWLAVGVDLKKHELSLRFRYDQLHYKWKPH
jgi:hypothetical protein